jgi:hypothetical protein
VKDDTKHWGGQLHMTLTNFAGLAGRPSAQRHKEHPGMHSIQDLSDVAKKAAEKLGTNDFKIDLSKWKNGFNNQWHYDSYHEEFESIFHMTGPSKDLDHVVDVLGSARLDGAVQQRNALHATFRKGAVGHGPVVQEFLAAVKWQICVVSIPDDNKFGTGLYVAKINGKEQCFHNI